MIISSLDDLLLCVQSSNGAILAHQATSSSAREAKKSISRYTAKAYCQSERSSKLLTGCNLSIEWKHRVRKSNIHHLNVR